MKKKIVYLMHIDWAWIKQRPHFIAEKLQKLFDVNVYYVFARNRKVLTSNPTTIKTLPLVTLPFKKVTFFRQVNKLLQKTYFSIILYKINPEIIWITHPTLHDYLPRKKLAKCKIVYDCMDDVLGFPNSSKEKEVLDKSEKRLFQDADIVFVSSEHLQNQIIKRGCKREKTTLVRNGYNGEIINITENRGIEKKKFTLGYVGTISNWINFDLIVDSLDKLDNIEYHFFGPIECEVPMNNRIIFHGPIRHSDLFDTIKECDALIMPFEINDLILSVDPVKLYEYVNFNKNIVTVYYKEIERFDNFVHFYRNEEEYLKVIKQLIENNSLKYSAEQRYEFLVNNTWDKRVEIIFNKLEI